MYRLVAALLLCVPLSAVAGTCPHEAPRHLQLDLAGVHGVQIEVNSYDLHATGTPGAKQLLVDGRACASDAAALPHLVVTQHREGDQLILELGDGKGLPNLNLFGLSSASLEATVQLPPEMPLTVRVGSGDANITGVHALTSTVGSGDLHASHVAGRFSASVGSGDVDAQDVGALQVGAVGSGDLKARDIHGDAKVGSIGSGDVTLRNVVGSVQVDTLGSGDLGVHDVAGDLTLGAKGSGDVDHSGVRGKISVPREDD